MFTNIRLCAVAYLVVVGLALTTLRTAAETATLELLLVPESSTRVAVTGELLRRPPGTPWTLTGQLADQTSQALVGDLKGFCVSLDADGLENQCLVTLTFPSGTLQVSGLSYFAPASLNDQNITQGLLAVTGGTGMYTGAQGYYQEYEAPSSRDPPLSNQNANSVPTLNNSGQAPPPMLPDSTGNGIIISISYGTSTGSSGG